ncbi:MAG: DNA repair protein RecN [Clostridia bacterium]|nr:DNA repair protein RecN [Clostridia bacterium]
MLDSLHIENVAVVKETDLTFSPGFTVLTGETGAGKSIIVDSVNLLLGVRSSRELIRSGETAATVSGSFSVPDPSFAELLGEYGLPPEEDGTFLLQRTITKDGKSSVRGNGRPMTVSAQKDIAARLIAIHGQHENQFFLDPKNHIRYLDRFAEDEAERKAYEEVYRKYRSQRLQLKELSRSENEKAQLIDLLTYQIREIDRARVRAGEEDELRERKAKLQNAEWIRERVKPVRDLVSPSDGKESTVSSLERAADAAEQLAAFYPEAAGYAEQLRGFAIEIEDLSETVSGFAGNTEEDPTAALDAIEERLEQLARLRKKYGSSEAEILSFRDQAKCRLDEIEQSGLKKQILLEENKKTAQDLVLAASVLTEKRAASGLILAERIQDELRFLDMDKVRFSVSVAPKEGNTFTEDGRDAVEFLISTNPGEPLKPLEKIASGGELSRIMLAAKCVLAASESMRALIFDEVDTGVSGKTSQKIGTKLKQLADSGCQVICVTHSAQIASQADVHLLISKTEEEGRAFTSVRELSFRERVAELARIMGGSELTDTVLAAAEELLVSGQNRMN